MNYRAILPCLVVLSSTLSSTCALSVPTTTPEPTTISSDHYFIRLDLVVGLLVGVCFGVCVFRAWCWGAEPAEYSKA
jgi:hypothetical protein